MLPYIAFITGDAGILRMTTGKENADGFEVDVNWYPTWYGYCLECF